MDQPTDRSPDSAAPGGQQEGSLIGKAVRLEGEITAGEPLTIAGQFKGRIDIPGHRVVVASQAEVEADIQAKRIVIEGKVKGKVEGSEKVEMTKTANLVGQLETREIRIEEGAVFRGQVDILTDDHDAKKG